MERNIFDDVMNYIDRHAKDSYNEIKRGIYAESNFTDLDLTKFLSVLTNGEISLNSYFIKRKLFFAAQELVENPEKPIVEIALEYGYSEQSSFTRAMKTQYGYSPNEIRKQRMSFDDKRIHFDDLVSNQNECGKRLRYVMECMMSGSSVNDEFDYFETFVKASEEYGFDTTTCYAISEVSERIGVPFGVLLNVCYNTMLDIRADNNYLDPRIEKCIDCGITSDKELDEILNYYQCEYYMLNKFMVNEYRKHNQNKPQ